ncbi:MAG: hypothetical protein IJ446_03280 [Oscillospiraceae bacterium]|nr:hypothetical protein [Oscillospiraceae bacterium]
MNNEQVSRYIQKHKAVDSDALIFQDWENFLNTLYLNNGHISMIIWYEYCRINEQKIGMGGYADKENREYMWAETQLFETDMQERTLNEILEYISEMRDKYSCYDLYPEFHLY